MKYIKAVSSSVEEILNKRAPNIAKKYLHTTINTNHVFLALFSFLASNKNDVAIGQMYIKLKDILNGVGIDGKLFEKKMLEKFPQGEITSDEISITGSDEYTSLGRQLILRSKAEARTMDIPDLIMELFNDKSFNLYFLFLNILEDSNKVDDFYNQITKAFKVNNVKREIKEFEKSRELTNLNNWVMEHPQHMVGGEENLESLKMCLLPKINKSAIITGKAGVGKSQLVYSFVEDINNGNVPDDLKNKIVYELNCGALVAGTRFRGDMEEKLINIVETCKKNPNIILFVDEIHMLVSLGSSSNNQDGAGNIIKPYITKGEIQIIGATTAEEYTKNILPDKAFSDRFHEIKLKEPTKEETIEILRGLKPEFESYFSREISDEIIEKIVDFSNQYSLEKANPRKSINMLDLACAHSKLLNSKAVSIKDITESMHLKYNVFISETKYEECRKELYSELLGQDEPLNQVCMNLKAVEAGLCEIDRPKFSMLLAGPTGTGKTEACKIIAKKYFGSENALVKLNMSEYASEMDVSKLVGSAPGYVGYEDESPLVKGVRENPSCIVLFDEAEKAHPSIWKVLLSILDTGEMQDNKGNKVSFKNTIIVFTTNLGTSNESGKAKGIGLVQTKSSKKDNGEIKAAIENYFSPEFLGRLDDIVIFNRLDNSIVDTLIERYRKLFNENSNLNITFTDEDLAAIKSEAKVEIAGARDLKRVVRRKMTKKQIESETVSKMAVSDLF